MKRLGLLHEESALRHSQYTANINQGSNTDLEHILEKAFSTILGAFRPLEQVAEQVVVLDRRNGRRTTNRH